ncbi:MAG: hypothetical protein IKJ39_00855 [Lachnospiraceae bacterium]|nr:hypothetical protein [Lachnospiraceae bacterium]
MASGIFASLQIELCEEEDKVNFESEHQLGTRPMMIDVLIIKKNSDEPMENNIARIFRKYNIVEYKSPRDHLSIDDFYKVYGYACFYKADVSSVEGLSAEAGTASERSASFRSRGSGSRYLLHKG